MAQTRCPRCGKPAILVDSDRLGAVVTRELGLIPVTERRIRCPPPAGCGADEEEVLVFWRVDLFQGTDTKQRCSH